MLRPKIHRTAWVITQEGTRHVTEVIGILSSRKSAKHIIKECLEWLYALLHYDPIDHFAYARYRNPEIPYVAQYMTTNIGVPVDSGLICGHNPYLVARRAKNVSLTSVDNIPFLKWTEPDRLEQDKQIPQNVKKIPGNLHQTPVHLPLNFHNLPSGEREDWMP
jgi:hypothetical protein